MVFEGGRKKQSDRAGERESWMQLFTGELEYEFLIFLQLISEISSKHIYLGS